MRLVDYLNRYVLEHSLARSSEAQLRFAVKLLNLWAEKDLHLEELTDDLLNRYLVFREGKVRPETVRSNRTALLTLWRAAADAELCHPPKRIRRIKRPELPPRAFTIFDLNSLLTAADSMPGVIRYWKVPKRLYWRAFILAAYDSGLRLSDVLDLRWRDIWWPNEAGDGVLVVVQRKTGHSQRVHFREATMKVLKECCAAGIERSLIFPPRSRSRFYKNFKRLCKSAGVQGSSKYLRRSGASYVAQKHGEAAASLFLGHRTPGLARKNYIDQRIAEPSRPMPPPLG